MTISSINSFSELNNKLEELAGRSDKVDSTEAICQTVRTHFSLIQGVESKEAKRLIQVLKQSSSGLDADEKVKRLYQDAIEALAKSTQNLESIQKFKKIDSTLYFQSLAYHISHSDRAINEFNLTEEEMLNAAPWLTSLKLDGVNRRECIFTQPFLKQILAKATSVESLAIQNCNFESSAFEGISKLKSMKRLMIKNCAEFQQDLKENPALERVELVRCDNYNQPISNLPRLRHLTVVDCSVFNEPIAFLPSLKTLYLNGCKHFNQPIADLPNLLKLTIYDCKRLNGAIENLPEIQELTLSECEQFNQKISTLESLRALTVEECPRFNQKLFGLHNLLLLDITDCFSFTIDSIPTALVLRKLDNGFFEKLSKNMGAEKLTGMIDRFQNDQDLVKVVAEENPILFSYFPDIAPWKDNPFEKLKSLYSEFHPIFSLAELQHEMRMETDEAISKRLDEMEIGDLLLTQAILHFPEVVAFLIKDRRAKYEPKLKEIGDSLDELPLESRIALLPLYPPDAIRDTILQESEETRKEWSDELVEYDQFSGNLGEVLREIKELNLSNPSEGERDNLLMSMSAFLKKIPLKSLGAFASLPGNEELLPPFFFAMDETQMAFTIPLFSEESFIQMMRDTPIKQHRALLIYASSAQKKRYVEERMIPNPLRDDWEARSREISEQIERFVSEGNPEQFEALETLGSQVKVQFQNRTTEFLLILKQLEKELSKHTDDPTFLDRLSSYLQTQREVTGKLTADVDLNLKKVQMLKQQIEGLIELPEEFVDSITGEPMSDPLIDKFGNILDKSTWNRTGHNPFNRASLEESELKPLPELKQEIDEFREKHPKFWE